MSDKTKNNLTAFGASGDIAEGFSASKSKKSAVPRVVIRLCFFYHLIVGIACAAVGFALDRESFITLLVCAAIEVVIAFFAAGGEMKIKAALVGTDLVLFAAGIIKAALSAEGVRIMYFIYGGAAIIGAVLAVLVMIAAQLKGKPSDLPVELPKRENAALPETQVSETATYELKMSIVNSIENKKKPPHITKPVAKPVTKPVTPAVIQPSAVQPPVMPPPVIPASGEMLELAVKLNKILNGTPKSGNYIPDARPEIDVEVSEGSDDLNDPEQRLLSQNSR